MIARLRRHGLLTLALALCALHAWMAASVSRTFSTTFDEIAHLTAGYAYWTQADYRFQPENGNLPQRLAALPLLAENVTFPPATGGNWRTANVWRVGHAFFYKSGNDLPAMLAAGRMMNALLSGVLCLLIFQWSRRLFGARAGLLSLLLAVFCPTLLANGGLITSDTTAALGFTAALLAWWRLLHKVSPGRVVAAGLCAGLLAVSKYSVVLFAPMAAVLVLFRLGRNAALPLSLGRRTVCISGWRRLPVLVGSAFVAIGICVTVIWSSYGFRYSAAPADAPAGAEFMESWDSLLLKNAGVGPALSETDRIDLTPGPIQHFVEWTRHHRLLPEAWLFGLAHVEKNARGRMGYFAGEYRLTGWRSFFPVTFAVKTPLPALALILLGILGVASAPPQRRRVWLYRLLPLLVLLAIYGGFSIYSRLNIGHRHLLPIYPALYVLAGGSLLLVRRHKVWILALAALVIWQAVESVRIRPDYLAYFNQMTGGPAGAHRLFVDSSLDWGQDLPRLKTWLTDHARGERVYLSYFGNGSPRHSGVEATRIGDAYFDHEERSTLPELTGGIYCMSATMLSRVYSPMHGPWTDRDEKAYRQLSAWLHHLKMLPAGAPPTWLDGTALDPVEVSRRLDHYEQLLLGRLCHFLQFRQPDALIGYSILVFRLSDEEVDVVLNAPADIR